MQDMRRHLPKKSGAGSFVLSAAVHAVVLFLLLSIPTCRRRPVPDHQVYTFELIDPSHLKMKETAQKASSGEKRAEKQKKSRSKKRENPPPGARPEKKKPVPKGKRVVRQVFEAPKKERDIEEKIREQIEKLDHTEWVEPEEHLERSLDELLHTGDFTDGRYRDAVASKIYQCWHTPSKIVTGEEHRHVVARFVIYRDGRVTGMRIESGSGSDSLDISALEAIRAAQPFPPLPDDYREETLEVRMTFIPEE